jgi:Leucine-rich repeat (LRR) protein
MLPAEAFVWEELIVLEVRGNAISQLPSTIGKLRSLRRIMIEMNRLSTLPAQICECSELTNLYIAYNKLTFWPDCIGKLTKLGDIWLRGNDIATLPDSFCDLPLYAGYMMNAGLMVLPECFGHIPFHTLELEGNKLTELPDSMRQLFSSGKLHNLVRLVRRLAPACALPMYAPPSDTLDVGMLNAGAGTQPTHSAPWVGGSKCKQHHIYQCRGQPSTSPTLHSAS